MRPILLCFMLFCFSSSWSQTKGRQLLVGQVKADSLEVENIVVVNKTSHTNAVTNEIGKFTLYAKVGDTLLFSSMIFNPRELVLEENDFGDPVFTVRLRGSVNAIEEVVVHRVKLSGDLNSDSKKIKTIAPYIPESGLLVDEDYGRGTELVNTSMPVTESSLTGINFIRILNGALGIFKKSKAKEKTIELPTELFADIVHQRFSYYFFTTTLKLKKEQISLFLAYCDTPEAKRLLLPDKEFELTDYLIKKSIDFLSMPKQ